MIKLLYLRFVFFVLCVILGSTIAEAQTTVNFTFTGSAQTWTVPPCVTNINVVMAGAKGGGPNGGNGARITANIPVTPGDILQINVGGMGGQGSNSGGWNGGGTGHNATNNVLAHHSYGGGGASDIRIGGTTLANRVIVAGAGGGSGGGSNTVCGGAAICTNGANGCASFGGGGGGGTQTNGGFGAAGWINTPTGGQTGMLGQGGQGGFWQTASGGGGGGGRFGGGGGGNDGCCTGANGGGGGGGGSSLMPVGGACLAANNNNHGYVTITYTTSVVPMTATNGGPYCVEDTIELFSTPGGISYSWTGPNGFTSTDQNPTIPNATSAMAGVYTVTAIIDDCEQVGTTTVVINEQIVPTFDALGPFCAGENIPDLPALSLNNYIGTWSPAINNQQTTTYTFTPDSGQCAAVATMTIVINPNLLPEFNQVGPFCINENIPALPTTSNNNFTGAWSPAINNQQTTTYTFTPTAGQCATTAALTITVNPNITPNFAPVGPFCANTNIAALPTTSTNNVIGTWTPAINNQQTTTYAFTSNAGQCASNATMTIAITNNATPTFTQAGPFCSGAAIPALPTTSQNNFTGTWSPAINNQQTTTYTFTPTGGQCALPTTMTITINPNILPTFNQVGPYCAGTNFPSLPNASTNNITGTWSPAINNQQTTTYTFTPSAGLCATTATMSISITPNVTPTFTQVGPFCTGSTIAALPTTSNNNVTGTWAPAINNTQTTTYTFTPSAGQCANAATMTITINQLTIPTFTQAGPFCANATIPALPSTSNNSITGAWTPAINNQTTTTYTFTPNPNQCAANASMSIAINPNITPTFNPVGPFCAGVTIPTLPTTSTNNFSGTWSPAINNNATTTYTFTPNAGQCALSNTLTIQITPNLVPQFSIASPYCLGATIPPLPTVSNNNFNGTWSPAINNQQTTTYTFTPNPGLCALSTNATIVINNPSQSLTNLTVCANGLPYSWNGMSLNSAGTHQAQFINTVGCDSTAVLNLVVLPVLTSTTNVQVCANQLPFNWNGLTLNNSGSHTVNLTSSQGCDSLATINFTVNPMPVISFTNNIVNGCSPLQTVFTNTSSVQGGTCLWNLGNGVIVNSCSSVTGNYLDFGCYDVNLQITSPQGCTSSLTQEDFVCVLPQPTASFTVNPQIMSSFNPTAQFTNTSIGSETQSWNFGGDTGNSILANPEHTYPEEAGNYIVTLVVANDNGCMDSTTQMVSVENEPIYYVPNTFTPDGDLFNETFKPVFTAGFDIYQYSFVVFNRWGEVLFESQNAKIGWDGTYGGQPAPQGSYIYQITFKELSRDKRNVIRGHFNLLR
jgi:gliding motility-associated-like protein